MQAAERPPAGYSKPFSKEYLQLLVKEIVLNGNSVRIRGGYTSLAGAIKFAAKKKKLSTPGEVLNFNSGWRPKDNGNEYWEICLNISAL